MDAAKVQRCGLEEHPRGVHDLGRPANWFSVERLDARFLIVAVHGASMATDAPWTATVFWRGGLPRPWCELNVIKITP